MSDSEPPKNSQRFIPSLEGVRKAATKLPSAQSFKSDSLDVLVDEYHAITFRIIKLKDARGRGSRWVYDGKVTVD